MYGRAFKHYENGLVDLLGSYDDAIALAAAKAGVADDYRVSYYPEKKDFLDELLEKMEGADVSIFGTKENLISPYIKKVESLQRMSGLQARMAGDLEIR